VGQGSAALRSLALSNKVVGGDQALVSGKSWHGRLTEDVFSISVFIPDAEHADLNKMRIRVP
jgi:hypothetical protein